MNLVDLPPVFFQMLQSFVTLGKTQNLSSAVDILGVSRQTIRRHISELEDRVGEQLFDTSYRHYSLTTRGELFILEAENLLKTCQACMNNTQSTPLELLSTEITIDENCWLYAQQHPLINVWSDAPPIIKHSLDAWSHSKGQVVDTAFDRVRPYLLVYRKYRGEWLIVEVGDKSAYATWLGVSAARSELGRGLDLGVRYVPLVKYWRRPYDAVLRTGGLWYEHISVSAPRHVDGEPVPVNYQRLIAAGKFPDGQPAVFVFAARTDTCIVPNMPEALRMQNMPEHLMDFEI